MWIDLGFTLLSAGPRHVTDRLEQVCHAALEARVWSRHYVHRWLTTSGAQVTPSDEENQRPVWVGESPRDLLGPFPGLEILEIW